MSNNSFKRYARFKNITSDTLKKINRIFVQSKVQATRFINLGADASKTEVVGSVKFDFQDNVLNSNNNANNEKIVLFASTHPGEDEILIDAFINLNQEIPSTKLVIVPRHPERANSISSMLNKKNISNYLSYNSSLNFNSESAIVIASIGLLSSLYSQASVAFVGGSLIGSSGGHNIIEPAAAGCPFVVGPYMYNFQDILEEFLDADACIQINEYKEIEQSLKSILTDKDQHEKINALALVRQNKGSSELQANKILQLLKN
jgi:3-deoxy-D-manno-octulosonic-acid transferase